MQQYLSPFLPLNPIALESESQFKKFIFLIGIKHNLRANHLKIFEKILEKCQKHYFI